MASNKKWYDSLSDVEKENLKAKRRQGAIKGSFIAAQLAINKTNERLENIFSIPWDELSGREKRYLISKEQQDNCSECGIGQIWNNKPLKFDLDHIDGNTQNNQRANLRLLCPNCHSQTDTYKVGNNKNPGKRTYTDEEIIEALLKNTSGYSAMKSLGMNPHGGNYTRVRKIIKDYKVAINYTV
jgi:hypothetical protein